MPLFHKDEKLPYKIEITEVPDINGDGAVDLSDIELLLKSNSNNLTILDGDGDFRSEESIEFLKEADVVVTNPPFSLFREYVAQLLQYKKKFILLSNMNAITYKEFFPYLMENEVWIGYGFNMSMVYKTPYPNLLESNRKFVISKGYNPDEGYVKVPAISWFTNIDIDKRHEELILYKKYSPKEYPKYDNYDAINVDRVSDIPYDYKDVIGVPITFLDKYNPDQFDILGISKTWATNFEIKKTKVYKNAKQHDKKGISPGNKVNDGGVIAVDEKPLGTYYTDENEPGKYLLQVYARIFIRRKHEN